MSNHTSEMDVAQEDLHSVSNTVSAASARSDKSETAERDTQHETEAQCGSKTEESRVKFRQKTTKRKALKGKLDVCDTRRSCSDKQLSSHKEVSFTEPDSEHMSYRVFSSLEEVDNYLMEQEQLQTTRFILNRQCKGFGTDDPGIIS